MVRMIEESMEIDELTGTISAKYPWKPCVKRMVDNERQARRVQESMERHMVKAGTHADYVAEMEKAIREEKVRKLSADEIRAWHGPTNSITTFAVIKPDSQSTKTRIVSNSAMKNAVSRLSINECMWPGPNALCDLLVCLLFWRAMEVAIMMDLQKAYQAIHTSPMELHLHRFLFRQSPKDLWEVYWFSRATFGDLSAGLVLEVAKRCVANMGMALDPMATQQIKDGTYVDDSILGGSDQDVKRMRGERIDGKYTGTVSQILGRGAMTVKFMAVTGSHDPVEEQQLGGKCLGVCYDIKRDQIFFLVHPCFYLKKAVSSDVARELFLLSRKHVRQLREGLLGFLRRQALSMVMGYYDPLCLISPAMVRGKLLLHRLYSPQVCTNWDQDLPKVEKLLWADWFDMLHDSPEIRFPRTTRPPGAVGPPRLVSFGDSALLAICVAVYVIWATKSGPPISRILMAKSRVAPLLGMTIPRGELQSLVVMHRMLLVIAEAFPMQFQSISSYTDSMCSIGALAKSSGTLKPFFSNRVSEILHLREQLAGLTDLLAPVHHVAGDLNPADLGTRGAAKAPRLRTRLKMARGPQVFAGPFQIVASN